MEFDLSRTIEGAAQDVQSAISAAGGLLPKNLPSPPTYEKVNPADALLMSIAVTSPDLPISKVDEYVENFLAPQISRIIGVGLVDYHGQQKPAIRVQINPAVAAAIGISLEDVRNALTQVEMNRARIEASQKVRELAQKQLQAEQRKFDIGTSTIRFILEEQRTLAQAESTEVAARVNYAKALVDFDRATGMTLKKNNIQLDMESHGPTGN